MNETYSERHTITNVSMSLELSISHLISWSIYRHWTKRNAFIYYT